MSRMATARNVKYCTQKDLSNLAKGMTDPHQKGCGWSRMMHFCMCNGGLEENSPWHANNSGQQCRQWQTSVSHNSDSRC